jgi:hypothetical protein
LAGLFIFNRIIFTLLLNKAPLLNNLLFISIYIIGVKYDIKKNQGGKVGHKIFYDQENKILKMNVNGNYSAQNARDTLDLFNSNLEGKPYRQLMVNLSKATKMEGTDTRKIQSKILKQVGMTEVAYVGASAATRMIAKVLMKLSSSSIGVQFFKDEDMAITWLKKQRGEK